jgi:hypothetical protein
MSDAIRPDDEWWRRFRLEQPNEYDLRPGVYRLIALNDTNTITPENISRVCGSDPTGTLYIGAASILMYRVSDLVKEHHPSFKSGPHKPLSARLAARFPITNLAISWEFSDDPWTHERTLLEAYLAEFGELPPHNDRR